MQERKKRKPPTKPKPDRIVDELARRVFSVLKTSYHCDTPEVKDQPFVTGDGRQYRRASIRVHTDGEDTFINITRKKV